MAEVPTQWVVVIGEAIGAANLDRLRTHFPHIDFRLCLDMDDFTTQAAGAHILFSKSFPPAALAAAKKLHWVQAGTAGVERLLQHGLGERGVLLTNATGAHGVPMSEMILAMMLNFATGMHTLLFAQRAQQRVVDQVEREKFELEGQTLCVIGLGDIGGTLAHKARALGMGVIGVRRTPRPHPAISHLYTHDQLLQALPLADHVALCLPLTLATTALIGAAELAAMRPSAYIYNVGRGGSIEPAALWDALQAGRIAGAGLDVTAPEPLPADSPLWQHPHVQLGQHTSGRSPFNANRITDIFMDNLARYLAGDPLRNVIDPEQGY
jgi:phosphoglycerate dehydrogenase-like enzyme